MAFLAQKYKTFSINNNTLKLNNNHGNSRTSKSAFRTNRD